MFFCVEKYETQLNCFQTIETSSYGGLNLADFADFYGSSRSFICNVFNGCILILAILGFLRGKTYLHWLILSSFESFLKVESLW